MQKVVFTGAKELERQLLLLNEKLAKRIARKALRAGAKPIFDKVKENAPVDEGRVKKALRLRIEQTYDRKSKSKQPELFALIGVRGPGSKESRPRKTKKKTKTRKQSVPKFQGYSYQIGSQPRVYASHVEYGTHEIAPQPFMRPAWDAEGGQTALDRIGKVLGDELEREASSTSPA